MGYLHSSEVVRSIKENLVEQNVSRSTDFRHLFRSLQEDSKCRQWLFCSCIRSPGCHCQENVSVRDRLFAPAPHLNRNIFSQLPVDSDVPANVAGDLVSGWKWCLADLVPYSSMYLAAVQRFSIFVFSQLEKNFI